MRHRHTDFAQLERAYGIHEPDAVLYLEDNFKYNFAGAMDAAQAVTSSTPNSGIPAFLTMYMDPQAVRILTTPNKAAQIVGEDKKGDWTTKTAMFMTVESTGEVASYDDWSENGSTGANVTFPQRQSYHYQTILQWGEKQLDVLGEAKLQYVSELNIAAAMTLDKFQNQTYFFGVSGLVNYGLLNDPALPASISPTTKVGATAWNAATTPNEVYADIQKLFAQLQDQTNGLLEAGDPLVLALSPQRSSYLKVANSFNVNVGDLLKANFPNMRIETAVQYDTAAGSIMQMIVPTYEGVDTARCAFTEKMRAHRIIPKSSSFTQKKSQGTWGCVIKRPFLVASMIGI